MSPTSDMIGVAVVGLGVGEQHLRAFQSHPRCRVLSVYDIDFHRAEKVAMGLDGCSVASSYEELLTSQTIDLLSIASFDDAHYEQTLDALHADKHVFVEKPLCRSLDELKKIKEAWNSAGSQVALGCNLILRSAPLYRWVRTQVLDGALGEIYAFDGDYLYGRKEKITDGWRRDVNNYSVVQGGGVHLVDLMLWITGQRPLAVQAVGNRVCTSGTAFRYHDFVAATYEFDSGIVGRITANFGCMHRHQHVLRIFGTNATFIHDEESSRLHTSRDPAVPANEVVQDSLPSSKGSLIPEFVDSILTGRDRREDTQLIFDGISACVAADEAARTNSRIAIEYV